MPDIGPGSPITKSPTENLTQLPTFMAAIRSVESGGNYSVVNSNGCRGAYQFCPETQMYAEAAAQGWTPAAQDHIAAQTMTAYFLGPAQGRWYYVAEAWNGGPGAIGNTALVGGYADKVMAEFNKLSNAQGLPGAQTNPVPPKITGSSGGGLFGGLAAIGNFFALVSNTHTWIRIGEFVLGAALAMFAVIKLFSGTSVGKLAAKVA